MSEPASPYVTPDSVQEACRILATHGPDAKVVAGGQSLSLLLRQGLLDPDVIVDISDLPEIDGITDRDGLVRIGATTTYSELGTTSPVADIGVLADAVDVIADEQVRNLGTIGGAVAHADPSLDILPPLRCLDTTVEVAGPDGTRRLPLAEFYEGYMETTLSDGELVAGLTVEAPGPFTGTAYEKYAAVAGGWATVGVASSLTLADDGKTIQEATVSLTAVDDTPVRARSAEERLSGEPATQSSLEAAAPRIPDDINPLADLSGSVSYKETLAVRLGTRSLERSLTRASGGAER